jgi:glycosyltransferase involved in cell wall biosynthesis
MLPSGAAPVTVVVLTLNEERNLPDCLDSLRGLKCTLFVVDSGSTDKTVELASRAGAVVLYHPFENYAAQRNWAQRNLPIQSPWVLHLDADERLTPALVSDINRVLRDCPESVSGYMLRKRTVFMGRWIRHGGHYPSYHLRLFRRDRGVCEDRLYDQHFVVSGRIRRLEHDYIDVVTGDLSAWTIRHTRWAELEARELIGGRASGPTIRPILLGNPIEQRRWLRAGVYGHAPLFARAFLYWLYRYVVRRGFLDGKEGLIFHFLQGCWFRFLVDANVFVAQRAGNGGEAATRRYERPAGTAKPPHQY